MIFTPLASSSAGNAYTVSNSSTTLLLECGLTLKELQKRLNYHLSDVTACLVTHEHQDHAKSASQLIKHGIPVYMSFGTAYSHKSEMDRAQIIKAGEEIKIGSFRVKAFRTYHNTLEPLGFLIWDTESSERLLFAIDTANLGIKPQKMTQIAIECNYEDCLLAESGISEPLKDRIRHSHFEINNVIKWLKNQDLSRVKTIYLLHLSARNSRAAAWLARFARELPGIEIKICEE